MGTNYYIHTKSCPTCGHKPEGVHLGKSSFGWKFTFRLNGEYYKNVKELKRWLKGKQIEDEYGEIITSKSFWNMVAKKQKFVDPDDSIAMVIDGYKFIDGEFS